MKENMKQVTLVNRQGQLEEVNWQDLRVGQIIKINEDESFPADVMIIGTSDEKGTSPIY